MFERDGRTYPSVADWLAWGVTERVMKLHEEEAAGDTSPLQFMELHEAVVAAIQDYANSQVALARGA